MDSVKITDDIAPTKNIDDTNQLKKDEVSEIKTLKKKSPNNEESKVTKPKNKEKKTRNNPDIAEMVLESIKSLKMRKGAPAEAIGKHISDKYSIDMKSLKPRVQRFLKNGLEKGYLEEAATGRFKIKRKDVPKKETLKKMKPIKNSSGPKKIPKAIKKNLKGN